MPRIIKWSILKYEFSNYRKYSLYPLVISDSFSTGGARPFCQLSCLPTIHFANFFVNLLKDAIYLTCGLYYKSFMIIIYDLNDISQYCKTTNDARIVS